MLKINLKDHLSQVTNFNLLYLCDPMPVSLASQGSMENSLGLPAAWPHQRYSRLLAGEGSSTTLLALPCSGHGSASPSQLPQDSHFLLAGLPSTLFSWSFFSLSNLLSESRLFFFTHTFCPTAIFYHKSNPSSQPNFSAFLSTTAFPPFPSWI